MTEFENTLLDGKVRLIQMSRGYRSGIDSIFLAAAVPARAGENVLDLGCGVGTVSFCLGARVRGVNIFGLDTEKKLVKLACKNRNLNDFGGKLQFFHGDLLHPPYELSVLRFDHVMLNPPFFEANKGNLPIDKTRVISNIEGEAILIDWIKAAYKALRVKGSISIIYCTDRVDDLLAALNNGFGDIMIFPLWSAEGKNAKRIIVNARKDVDGPATIKSGIILHDNDGSYSDRAEGILKGASSLNGS